MGKGRWSKKETKHPEHSHYEGINWGVRVQVWKEEQTDAKETSGQEVTACGGIARCIKRQNSATSKGG